MANLIYKKLLKTNCPRCGASEATVSIYHFGATYQAECSGCGFGRATGDNEEIALSRLYGNFLEIPQK